MWHMVNNGRTDVAHPDTQRTYLVFYLVITEDKCGPCDMAPKVTKIREMKQILPAVAHCDRYS